MENIFPQEQIARVWRIYQYGGGPARRGCFEAGDPVTPLAGLVGRARFPPRLSPWAFLSDPCGVRAMDVKRALGWDIRAAQKNAERKLRMEAVTGRALNEGHGHEGWVNLSVPSASLGLSER